MTTAEILTAIGDFGIFQKILLVLLTFPYLLLLACLHSFIFIQSDPERHCNTDWILGADPNLTIDEQLDLTVPREKNGTFSQCLMFVPVDWNISVIRERGLNETTRCQDGWVYYNTQYEATIVTDYDLVCDMSMMTEIVQTVFLVGSFCGALFFGPLAESFGRRRTIQITVILLLIFYLVSGSSSNFYVYVVSQFITGAALTGYRINASVLATEWIGVTKRSLATCMSQIFCLLGVAVIAVVVYFVRDWRIVQFILAGVQAIIFLYIWWIPESARWLLEKGRKEQANEVIQRVATINKKSFPEDLLLQVPEKQKMNGGGVKEIFTTKVLAKYFLIVSFAWFSLNLGYFSLILNVGKFGLSIFLVQFLFGISEIPAHLLCFWILELVGRKKSLMATLLTGGLFCLIAAFVSQDHAAVIIALVTIGKCFLNWGGSVCMVYMQELFPTSARQAAVALAILVTRLSAPLSPPLNMLARYHHSIPILIFSSLAVISGTLVIFLPETRNKDLPDSGDVAEENRNINTKKSECGLNMAANNCINATKF